MEKKQNIIEAYKRYREEESDTSLLNELDQCDSLELEDRLKKHLSFGTAGIRARVEAGYNRMNMVSVHRVAYGLAHVFDNDTNVVVGYDARKLSDEFALQIAKTMGVFGFNVYIFTKCIPTPLCAFAAKYLNALGVMVTASHNPPMDNGVKLFNKDSSQLVGDDLIAIEEQIALAMGKNDFMTKYRSIYENYEPIKVSEQIISAYLDEIHKTKLSLTSHNKEFSVVYTPLHGVGKETFLQALKHEGYSTPLMVKEQAEPDSNFSTVKYPNPEEEHSLDMAYQMAYEHNCSWVMANDPDADRLQVATLYNKKFSKLSGNEMGAILGYFAIISAQQQGIKPLLASSIVSSRMLESICGEMGAMYVDALTGFANITEQALRAQNNSDHTYVFSYEEAIGFSFAQAILDKDGINAGLRFLQVIAYLDDKNKTVWQLLDELYLKFGIFVSHQWSLRFDGTLAHDKIAKMMSRIRQVSENEISSLFASDDCKKIEVANGKVIIFEQANKFRFLIRPSGTEPKIKFYLELMDRATDLAMVSNKKARLEKLLLDYANNIKCFLSL